MKSRVGILILIVVIAVVVGFALVNRGKGGSVPGLGAGNPAEVLSLKGYVGGEKINFLQDPDVVKILQEKYGITLDADKRGSIEMVQQPADKADFLWPSNELALAIYKQQNPSANAETIFNSPIVVYSWDAVTDALMKQGIVKLENGAYYVVDFGRLVSLMDKETTWQSLGLDQLHGKLLIYSTDPGKSSSGNLFSALLAVSLTGDDASNPSKLKTALPAIKRFFDKQGLMRESSKDLFEEFMSRGMGNKQLVIGYEAQLIEYYLEHPQAITGRQNAVRTLYPRPTVWSAHPLIALNANAKRLITALKDPQIQEIAWRKHGFRSAEGTGNDPKSLGVAGIPARIDNVVQIPAPNIMETVQNAISGK